MYPLYFLKCSGCKNIFVHCKRVRIEKKKILSGSGHLKKITIRIRPFKKDYYPDPGIGTEDMGKEQIHNQGPKHHNTSQSGFATRLKTKQRNITHYTTRRIKNFQLNCVTCALLWAWDLRYRALT